MPELPEVETVRKGLEIHLKEFLIDKVEILSERTIASEGGSKNFSNNLIGLEVGSWERRGKYLICGLTNPIQKKLSGWLVVHLRMTGYFQWLKREKAVCAHTRVRIWNKDYSDLRFVDTRNCGEMWWIDQDHLPEVKI